MSRGGVRISYSLEYWQAKPMAKRTSEFTDAQGFAGLPHSISLADAAADLSFTQFGDDLLLCLTHQLCHLIFLLVVLIPL